MEVRHRLHVHLPHAADKARAFRADPRVQEAMAYAGVARPPRWFARSATETQ